jgi:hypothetical protein
MPLDSSFVPIRAWMKEVRLLEGLGGFEALLAARVIRLESSFNLGPMGLPNSTMITIKKGGFSFPLLMVTI